MEQGNSNSRIDEIIEANYSDIVNKEVDLVQDCIGRMSKTSFIIKGWCISLIGIIIALKSNEVKVNKVYALFLAIVFMFWLLDAFYLKTERVYRNLYEDKVEKRFKMDYTKMYSLEISALKTRWDWPRAFISPTIALFYISLMIIFSFILKF